MRAKRTIFERLAAGVLALVLVFGIVAMAAPDGLTTRVEAAEQVEYPAYHVYNRLRKDGLYTIHPSFDLGLALDITMDSVDTQYANTVLDDAKADPSQRFVIQLDEKKSGSLYGADAIYGIRSLPSNWFIGGLADSNVQQRIANYRNETISLWQFIYNDDGTVFIKNNGTGQYLYGVGQGNANVLKDLPADGSDLSHFKWVLSQTHMPDSFFTTGTYWLQTRVDSGDGDSSAQEIPADGHVVTVQNGGANVSAYVPAAALITNEDGTVTRDPNSAAYESQHFVIQKLSGGFYSIINVSTGKYLAVGSDGGIIEGQSSGAAPAAAEKWIIYPGKASGNTDTAAWKFRIISAVDGSQLTLQANNVSALPVALAVGEMQNAAVQDWFLKDIRLDINNASKGDTQIVGSGVYADTFNTENTVTLPIKIFDYAADGMLFEYASLDAATEFAYLQVEPGQGDHVISDYTYILVGQPYGDYTLNADGVTYTKVADGQGEYKRDPIYTASEGGDYLKYRLGCNLGFSMLSCSKGGTNGLDWAPSSFGEGLLTWPIQNAGNGSASFGYNKYYCGFNSELRLLYEYNSATQFPSLNDGAGLDYERVVNGYVFNGKYSQGGFRPAVLVTAGTMNTATAGIDYSFDALVQQALGYTMIGQQTFGQATMGLMEGALETVTVGTKTYTLPRYRQETVEYIAMLLQRSLEINRKGEGILNYNYVDGEPSFADDTGLGLDLAALLRGETDNPDSTYVGVLEHYSDSTVLADGETKLGTAFTRYGSYADTLAKVQMGKMLIGSWADVKDNIDTCMDAAYWMLNSIFLENSYNQPQNKYNSLILTQVTDQEGKTGYIFDSTFINSGSSEQGTSAVQYDSATGTIRNTSAAGKSYTYWGTNSSAATFPFTPVRANEYDENGNLLSTGDGTPENPKGHQNGTQSAYLLDGGVLKSQVGNEEAEYENANYNFVLQSNAYFVYKYDDGLFFEFEGDDDVYLFINGQLVLDIGGAHAVTGTKLNLNDYVDWARELKENTAAYNALSETEKARVDALALVEGHTYSFDFYYMERHGWGSNMRIFTNFQLASGEIEAEKAAAQAEELSYGSVIDETQDVQYTFTLKNAGTSNLICPSFADSDLGLAIGYETGLTFSKFQEDGSPLVTNARGESLTAADLIFTYKVMNGDQQVSAETHQFGSNEEIMQYLSGLVIAQKTPEGTYGVLTVGGIYYKLTAEQIQTGAFHNEVEVTAYVRDDGTGGKVPNGLVRDDAKFSVYLLSRPLYYQWQGHKLEITGADILAQVQIAASDGDNPLSALVKPTIKSITNMTIVDNSDPDSFAAVSGDTVLTVNYADSGTYTLGLTIDFTYENEDQTVESATATIPVQFFVLNVLDQTYVLDYGLKAQVSWEELFGGDELTAEGRDTVFEVLGLTTEDKTPLYVSRDNESDGNINSIRFNPVAGWSVKGEGYDGTFDLTDGENLTYTPTDFMDGHDDLYLAIRVRESAHAADAAIGSTDIANEVEMFKKITFLPATVVYYEDDFSAIQYHTETGNAVESTGSSAGMIQSTDQNAPYGSDPIYRHNDELEGSAAVSTDCSGGTLHTVTVQNEEVFATFDFTGTGFEIIGSTNAVWESVMIVTVKSGDTVVRRLPVITEFDNVENGEGGTEVIYQVPVIRVDGLEKGSYTVEISANPARSMDETTWWTDRGLIRGDYDALAAQGLTADSIRKAGWVERGYITEAELAAVTDEKGGVNQSELLKALGDFKNAPIITSKLYIDGVRVFQPLGQTDDCYNARENGTEIVELRKLITEGKAAFLLQDDENGIIFGSGYTTWTENRNGTHVDGSTYTGHNVHSLNDYLALGPNNEVYLRWTQNSRETEKMALVLYVTEEADVADRTLQFAFRVTDYNTFKGDAADGLKGKLRYGVRSDLPEAEKGVDNLGNFKRVDIVCSGTEQYYDIDYTQCPYTEDENGIRTYEVVVTSTLDIGSFTSLKYKGLTIAANGMTDAEKLTLEFRDGVLVEKNELTGESRTASVYHQRIPQLASLLAEADLSGDYEQKPSEEQPPTEGETDPTESTSPVVITPETGNRFPVVPVLLGLIAIVAILVLAKKARLL